MRGVDRVYGGSWLLVSDLLLVAEKETAKLTLFYSLFSQPCLVRWLSSPSCSTALAHHLRCTPSSPLSTRASPSSRPTSSPSPIALRRSPLLPLPTRSHCPFPFLPCSTALNLRPPPQTRPNHSTPSLARSPPTRPSQGTSRSVPSPTRRIHFQHRRMASPLRRSCSPFPHPSLSTPPPLTQAPNPPSRLSSCLRDWKQRRSRFLVRHRTIRSRRGGRRKAKARV